jgi:3-deoxy-D-manno-octulosonic-acid transferase
MARLWYALYNALLHVGALVCVPFWLVARLVRGRYRGQFKERMGLLPREALARFGSEPALWVHAASAGETTAAAPLLRELRAAFPRAPLLFTVTSRYGKEMAHRRLGDLADAVLFSPLDLPLFVARFLNRIRPFLYVMVETDLWPNMVRQARRRGAKVALASGHAGERRAWRFLRSFGRATLGHVDLFLMQTEEDARRIVERGAPADRVQVLGSLKFDSTAAYVPSEERPALRADLGVPEGARVLVAGSTLAEDEGPVLDLVAALRREGVPLFAIVAPRRQERVREVVEGGGARGLACALRTRRERGDLLVLDTMGELARAYNVADVAYVGGGFTPDVGLHNILEPMVCGVPVLFGPHHGKAWRAARELLRAGAGREVADGKALLHAVRELFADAEAMERMRRAGEALLRANRGAAARQAARIRELVA